jgi:hypothetical protein
MWCAAGQDERPKHRNIQLKGTSAAGGCK